MLLRHLHLPFPISYPRALRLQDALIAQHLAHVDARDAKRCAPPLPPLRFPLPLLLTLEHTPVYTLGRRAASTISDTQREFLRDDGKAEVYDSSRGGLETFHGPGQLVAYPLIDLRYHKLTFKRYVWKLEETVIRMLRDYHITAQRTTNPGVWMPRGDRKIASVGLSVRRGITKFGVALNYDDEQRWLAWGFSRITACGLEGKRATDMDKEGMTGTIDDVAEDFAHRFAEVLADGKEDIQIQKEEFRDFEKMMLESNRDQP